MVRQLFIEANNGLRFDLMDKKHFLNLPSGLGFAQKSSYSKIGEYFIANNQELSQKSVQGEMIFTGNWYRNYLEFATFIKQYSSYKLVYGVNNQEYLIDIDFQMVSKGDTRGAPFLNCPVMLLAKSLFYRSITREYEIQEEANENRWDLNWSSGIRWQDSVAGVLSIRNQGQVPSAWAIEIEGAVNNPRITIWNEFGTEKVINFNIEIGINEKLRFSTVDYDLHCQKVTSTGEIVNILDALDYQNDNFVKLDIGANTITVEDSIPKAKFTLFESYVAI